MKSASQELFAFEWEDLGSHHKRQHCWTVLPQEFKISPLSLGQDPKELTLEKSMLVYVDDILTASPTHIPDKNTVFMLKFPARKG